LINRIGTLLLRLLIRNWFLESIIGPEPASYRKNIHLSKDPKNPRHNRLIPDLEGDEVNSIMSQPAVQTIQRMQRKNQSSEGFSGTCSLPISTQCSVHLLIPEGCSHLPALVSHLEGVFSGSSNLAIVLGFQKLLSIVCPGIINKVGILGSSLSSSPKDAVFLSLQAW